jgi:inward rectifier potassium channel
MDKPKPIFKTKSRRVRIGRRKIETQGLENNFWTDFYHLSITISWPKFFISCVALFLFLNVWFAFLYWMGDNPIANTRPGNFMDCFFFSVQTLATVGYGYMYPQTIYGNIIATIELYTGIIVIATNTGLTFARFSRPRSRIVFAKHPVVGIHDGKNCLMIRMANARHNTIVDARGKIWLIKSGKTLEGNSFRKVHSLNLLQPDHPLLTLGWTVLHVIDEASPLYNMTETERKEIQSGIVISIHGFDKDAASDMHASKVYSLADVKWDHVYVDLISEREGNITHVDFSRFHEVCPIIK